MGCDQMEKVNTRNGKAIADVIVPQGSLNGYLTSHGA
jgi:hypothetical protein